MLARVRDMGINLGGHVFHRQSNIARDGDLGRLSGINVPTLIIAADTDALRSPAEAQELVDGISGVSLTTIPNSSHMIPLEQPEALSKTIAVWLER